MMQEQETTDALDLVRHGDVEDVTDVLEAILQRMERMTEGEVGTVASMLRDRRSVGGDAIDAMTDVMMSID